MDKFDFALQVTVVGFSVVMVTLFLLYGILAVFSRLFNKEEIKDLKNESAAISLSGHQIDTDNRVLTAVITAAVYSYLRSNGSTVKTAGIKITAQPASCSGMNSWQITGRRHLMETKAELETTRRNK